MNSTATLSGLLNHIGTWIHVIGLSIVVILGIGAVIYVWVKNKFSIAALFSIGISVLAAAVLVWYLPALIGVARNSGPEITGLNPSSGGGTYGMSVPADMHGVSLDGAAS